MEFIKHNQLLKVRVAYDNDSSYIEFKDFIQDSGIEPVGEHAYAYFPNAPRWTESEINGMGEIHPELRDSALEAVAEIDYTDINQ